MTHLHAKLSTKIKIIFPTSYISHHGEWHYHSPTPPIWGSFQICPSHSVLLFWQLLTHSPITPAAHALIFPLLDHFNSWWIDPCSQSLLPWFILYTLTRLGFPSPNITMLSLFFCWLLPIDSRKISNSFKILYKAFMILFLLNFPDMTYHSYPHILCFFWAELTTQGCLSHVSMPEHMVLPQPKCPFLSFI